VKVAEQDKIKELHQILIKNFSAIPEISDQKDLHPHLTIATRDLEEGLFPAARDFLSSKEYETRFEVDGISLLKHNGREWEIFMNFSFKKS
jgi:2'-5' RNA ligase